MSTYEYPKKIWADMRENLPDLIKYYNLDAVIMEDPPFETSEFYSISRVLEVVVRNKKKI